jgi:hypothetical protein
VPKFAEPAAYTPQHLAERTLTFEAAVLRRKPSAWDTELDLIRAAAELTAAAAQLLISDGYPPVLVDSKVGVTEVGTLVARGDDLTRGVATSVWPLERDGSGAVSVQRQSRAVSRSRRSCSGLRRW